MVVRKNNLEQPSISQSLLFNYRFSKKRMKNLQSLKDFENLDCSSSAKKDDFLNRVIL